MEDEKPRAFKKVSKVGRPTDCTPAVIKKITNAMVAGAYIETAAAYAQVSKEALHSWLRKGREKPDSIYGEFVHAVDKAIADCELRDLMNIDKAAMGGEPTYMRDKNGGIVFSENGKPIVLKPGMAPNWSASAWRLERRFARKYAKLEMVEQSGPNGGPIQLQAMTEEQLLAERNRLKKIAED